MWKQTAIQNLSPRKRKALRKDIQMIYQNSTSTFHPLQSIGTSIAEPLLNYKLCTKAQAKKQVTECMEQVGLSESFYQRLPKELSGGQRQRANIARGIILHPQLIVCDEVVSSLDFSLRTQILNLLNDLKKQYHLSYLFISHDLSTVKYVCNKAIIMYRGVIVEKLETTEHLEQTVCHPYSKELFAAVPVTSPFCVKKDIFLSQRLGRALPHKDVYFKIVVHTVKTSAKKYNLNYEKWRLDILLHVMSHTKNTKEK